MKKVLLIVLVLAYLKVNAQVPAPPVLKDIRNNSMFTPVKKGTQSGIKRSAAQGWFDPATASSVYNSFPLDLNQQQNLFLTPIWADSAIIIAYSNTFAGPQIMGAGMIFDPRDPIYQGNPFNTSKFTTYIVDSIEIPFLYTRKNLDVNVIDRVNFYSFKAADMLHYISVPFGTVYYDKTTNAPAGTTVKTLHTESLGVTDSSSGGNLSSIKFACNEKIPGSNNTGGSNWFGIYFNYQPGSTYPTTPPFDTIGYSSKDFSGNKHNRFQYLEANDPSSNYPSDTSGAYKNRYQQRIYNHGVYVVDDVRYTTNTPTSNPPSVMYGGNWVRAGLPFTRFPAFTFHVTTQNLAVKNSSNDVTVLDAYPNPAKANSEVVLSLKSLVSTDAVVTLTDMSGKVIKTFNTSIVNGKNSISISTDALCNGMYLVNISGEGFQSSSKLIIE